MAIAVSSAESNPDFLSSSASSISLPLTIHARVRRTASSPSASRAFVQLRETSTGYFYGLGHNSIDQLYAMHHAGAFNQSTYTGTITSGNWYSHVGVFTSVASRQVFIDNISATENTDSLSSITVDNVRIRATMAYDVADIAVWGIALSSSDRAMLAKGVSPLLVRPDALVYYFPTLRANGSGDQNDVISGVTVVEGTYSYNFTPNPPIFLPSAQILQFPPTAAAAGFSPYWAAGSNVIMNNGSP